MTNNFEHQHDTLDHATADIATQAHDLAATIQDERLIPAPNAYTALANLKTMFWRLRDAITSLNDRLQATHHTTQLQLDDHDPITGEIRDPAESLHLTGKQLQTLSQLLADAGNAADIGQNALDGQNYRLTNKEPDTHETPSRIDATPEQLARHRRRLQAIQNGHITADEAIAQLLEEEAL